MDSKGIVIYSGLATTMAGMSGDEKPKVTIANSTGAGANPIKDGAVSDWEAMEQLWRETCLDNLRVSPEDQPILLAETLKFTKEDRETATKIFFDKLNVPGFYLANAAVLSMYATGRVSGLAVIVDEKSTSVIPVYQSVAMEKGAQHNVSNDEVAEAACNAIMRSSSEQRLEMFRNILVSGDNPNLSSIANKLKAELHHFAAPEQEASIIVPSNAKYLTWIGGSVLTSQDQFKGSSAWITREEYNEHGAGIVNKRSVSV